MIFPLWIMFTTHLMIDPVWPTSIIQVSWDRERTFNFVDCQFNSLIRNHRIGIIFGLGCTVLPDSYDFGGSTTLQFNKAIGRPFYGVPSFEGARVHNRNYKRTHLSLLSHAGIGGPRSCMLEKCRVCCKNMTPLQALNFLQTSQDLCAELSIDFHPVITRKRCDFSCTPCDVCVQYTHWERGLTRKKERRRREALGPRCVSLLRRDVRCCCCYCKSGHKVLLLLLQQQSL